MIFPGRSQENVFSPGSVWTRKT